MIAEEVRVQRLQHPARKVRIVLDTDTYNEIDDQFAVTYALLAPEHLQVEALYAAPFYNELSDGPADGMEKSYQELLKIRAIFGREEIPVFRGATDYLPAANLPYKSDAAQDLVERAMASAPEDPLYVLAIGAITNVASALLMEPQIADRIVIVWLGGHDFHWSHTKEFNLCQDLHASRLIFDCGAPVVLAPCLGVSSHLTTSLSELADYVKDEGQIGRYLYDTYKRCADDHYGYSRVIWDISVVAWLVNPQWCLSSLVPSPYISDECRWSVDTSRHLIRKIDYFHRDAIFQDLFRRIAGSH